MIAILLCLPSLQANAQERTELMPEAQDEEMLGTESETQLQYDSQEPFADEEQEQPPSYANESSDDESLTPDAENALFEDSEATDPGDPEMDDADVQEPSDEDDQEAWPSEDDELPCEDGQETEPLDEDEEEQPESELSIFSMLFFGQFVDKLKEVTIVLHDGETVFLDLFPMLERLDATGSENYEEIFAWAYAHPNVELIYSVQLPNGEEVQKETETVFLYGTADDDIPETIRILRCLPNLRCIDLGSGEERTDISLESIDQLRSELPDTIICGCIPFMGEEIDIRSDYLDFRTLLHDDVQNILPTLRQLTEVRWVSLGAEEESDLTWDDIRAIGECLPDASFDFAFLLYDNAVNLADEILDLNHIQISDQGEAVRAVLPLMRNCIVLDMDSCSVSNEHMAVIRDENPGVDVVWRVWFGEHYSVRTNVTKILASMPSVGGRVHDRDGAQLMYCTKVRYLDLGHNADLTDVSFVTYMPELEIAVISITNISDLSPFASCSNLKYLEAGNCKLSDLSPLAACKNLRHLNVGTNFSVNDISPLYELDLKRLWLGIGDPVPEEQVAMMRELHPDCIVNTTVRTGLEEEPNEGFVTENWKSYQRYLSNDWEIFTRTGCWPAQRPLGWWKVVFKCFGYHLGQGAYAFSWNDPKFGPHDPDVFPVNTQVWDTSFLDEDFDIDAAQVTCIPDNMEELPGICLFENYY